MESGTAEWTSNGYVRAAFELPPGGTIEVDGRTWTKKELFIHAIDLDASNASAYANLGAILDAGEVVEALGRRWTNRDLFMEAIRQDPAGVRWHIGSTLAYFDLGTILKAGESVEMLGKHWTNRDLYMEAIKQDPTYSRAYTKLSSMVRAGESIEMLGRHWTSRDLCIEAIKQDRTHALAYVDLAQALQVGESIGMLGKRWTKKDLIMAAIKQDPTYARAYADLSNALQSGESIEMLGSLWTQKDLNIEALKQDPGAASAYFNLGTILNVEESLEMLGKSWTRRDLFEEAIKQDAAYGLAYFNLSASLQAGNASARAIEASTVQSKQQLTMREELWLAQQRLVKAREEMLLIEDSLKVVINTCHHHPEKLLQAREQTSELLNLDVSAQPWRQSYVQAQNERQGLRTDFTSVCPVAPVAVGRPGITVGPAVDDGEPASEPACEPLTKEQKWEDQDAKDDALKRLDRKGSSLSRLSRVARIRRFKYAWSVDVEHGVRMKDLLGHPLLDTTSAVVIMANSVLLGVETNMGTRIDPFEPPSWLWGITLGCNIYFLLEVLVRLSVLRLEFVTHESRSWNIFDLVLVILSMLDYAMERDGGTRAVKTMRMLRILRLFRVFRFSRQLASLAEMIMDSLLTLVWTLCMVFLLMYAFAVTLTGRSSDWIKSQVDTSKPSWYDSVAGSEKARVSEMADRFGDIARTWHTLLKCVLGGTDWGDVTDLLSETDQISMILLLVYIMFCMLAILNIVTGVFLDNALQTAKNQREYQLERAMQNKSAGHKHMKIFFELLDIDGSGAITQDELEEMLLDPDVADFFEIIVGFDASDADVIFRAIDKNRRGTISLDEFLAGCDRLKSHVRAVDIVTLSRSIDGLKRDVRSLHEAQRSTQG
eukprot:TRINITY_DN28276_c0_g1_i1.p1 TRINITY_DN28276_c0_g1~~TRINITY_DN28276_c0_g1_i1.p1  ORF type:complete len:883 (+),score=137.19 TRINITY_DN28276_c0_g1_i1:43-2691(+)